MRSSFITKLFQLRDTNSIRRKAQSDDWWFRSWCPTQLSEDCISRFSEWRRSSNDDERSGRIFWRKPRRTNNWCACWSSLTVDIRWTWGKVLSLTSNAAYSRIIHCKIAISFPIFLLPGCQDFRIEITTGFQYLIVLISWKTEDYGNPFWWRLITADETALLITLVPTWDQKTRMEKGDKMRWAPTYSR